MHQLTDVLRINSPDLDKQCIFDMCMAPGGFRATALRINPKVRAIVFGLPKYEGGDSFLLPKHPNVSL